MEPNKPVHTLNYAYIQPGSDEINTAYIALYIEKDDTMKLLLEFGEAVEASVIEKMLSDLQRHNFKKMHISFAKDVQIVIKIAEKEFQADVQETNGEFELVSLNT